MFVCLRRLPLSTHRRGYLCVIPEKLKCHHRGPVLTPGPACPVAASFLLTAVCVLGRFLLNSSCPRWHHLFSVLTNWVERLCDIFPPTYLSNYLKEQVLETKLLAQGVCAVSLGDAHRPPEG